MQQSFRNVDLVGVGLNATDTLIQLAAYPSRGSKVEYTVETIMPGGQVASTVAACQSWGLTSRYVGKVGNDDAARVHAREFSRLGVEAQMIEVPDAQSPKSLILVDWDGERTVLCRRDERLVLQPKELNRDWIVNARTLHVDGHDTAAASCAARWASEAGVTVIADLDEVYPGVDDLLQYVDYLIASRDLPRRLTGQHDLEAALRMMQSQYASKLTAATLGDEGVLAWDGERFHHVRAYDIPVVDTTGAGDIFHAGFIYGLHQGWPLVRQLEFACAAAAMNCMFAGARGGIGSVEAIEQLMATKARHPAPQSLAALSRSAL